MHTPTFASASLYVGDLHTDITESQLYDIFKQLGVIASIRVCRDAVTRRSLGYAYVNFHNVLDAERAIDVLNYKDLKGKPMRIMWSQRDPSLRKSNVGNIFVKNLGKDVDNKVLYDSFSVFGNILSCKVSTDERGQSKGYGFVHFESAESAEAAVNDMNGKEINGKKWFVGPFQARKERTNDEPEEKWTNIYVKHLDKSFDEEKVRQMFEKYGPITSAVIMRDENGESKGFGFVNFEKHEDAEEAIKELNEKEIDGKTIYVGRAQKKSERERELKDMFLKIQRERLSKYQGVNLYVKNLDESVDDEKLRQEFSACGTITSAKVMTDDKNVSKGFGFVCFATPEEATKAVTEMNGKNINDKPIYVALAQKKDQRKAQLETQHNKGGRNQGQNNAAAAAAAQAAMFKGAIFYPQPGFVYPPQPQMVPRGRFVGAPRGPVPFQPVPGYVIQGAPGQQQQQQPRGGKGRRGGKGGAYKLNSNVRNPQQAQQSGVSVAGVVLPPAAVKVEDLANLSITDQKNLVGEHLFQVIGIVLAANGKEDLTGKITGMLLESMEPAENIGLLSNVEGLQKKINEALVVLQAHMKIAEAADNAAVPQNAAEASPAPATAESAEITQQ